MVNFNVSYLRTSALPLCYSDVKLQGLIDRVPAEGVVAVLLTLPPSDARRVCAGLMSRPALVEWSAYSARRAKEYAATYVYAAAARAAADAVAAARAAAAADAYAVAAYHAATDAADSYAVARRKDNELSIRDACRLLGWM